MNTTFQYDETAAIDLAIQYSDAPNALKALISRLNINVGAPSVVKSPFARESRSPLNALQMWVEVNGYGFRYFGSHNDAEAFKPSTFWDSAARAAKTKALTNFKNGLLYSLLCSIRCDYYADSDPEEIGLNPDSINEMAKFNEIREHARKLRAALRLTQEELNSLPS